MSDNRANRQRPEWKEGTRFTLDGVTAVVSVSQGFRTRYSVQVGRLREDGSVAPHLPVQTDGTFQVKVAPLAKTLLALGEKVEEWISTDTALRLDERIAREERDAGSGRGEVRVTGKTARNKAKKSGRSAET